VPPQWAPPAHDATCREQWKDAFRERRRWENCHGSAPTLASFGSEALRVIGRAFDAAWTEIAGKLRKRSRASRGSVAEACHGHANGDTRDVEVLKKAAIERMAMDYRLRRQV
jgi:hypothetical protein